MKTSALKSAVQDVLQQGCTLLRTVSNETYTQGNGSPGGSSLGAHYRHVLDHFICLLDGLAKGRIDYDRRQRSPEIESSLVEALDVTESLLVRFDDLPEEEFGRDCVVVYSVGYQDREEQAVPSNVAREVMFCVGHAIHHYAILKMLCMAMAVPLPYEFGIAPSTLKHLEAAAH